MKTAKELRAKAADCETRAAESFERCDTDGFVTQWASGLTAQLNRARAEIVEAGGLSDFIGLYHGDRRIRAKRLEVKTSYHTTRTTWMLDDDDAAEFGRKWIPAGKRSRIQKALGLREAWEAAPAYAFMSGRGTGLSGTAWVQVARSGCKWGSDAVLGTDEVAP